MPYFYEDVNWQAFKRVLEEYVKAEEETLVRLSFEPVANALTIMLAHGRRDALQKIFTQETLNDVAAEAAKERT